MRQRIYKLQYITQPERIPEGRFRAATMRDLEVVAEWMAAFGRENGVTLHTPADLARRRIEERAIFLWEDLGPVSMAGWTGRTQNGVRVGYVYTPPSLRRRGYASACVADLSQLLLESGLRFCFLYTDLSNPTSNSIYQHIGYRPVCDVVDYTFEVAGS